MLMETITNEFTNGEITVSFEPKKCIHAEKCAQGLSEVFRTSVIPKEVSFPMFSESNDRTS